MRVLLVTYQVIADMGDFYMSTMNMYDILKRFSSLGDLHIAAVKYNGNNSHTKIESNLTGVVDYGNITFIKKDYITMSKSNKRILMDLVSNSDLVISYAANYDLYRIAKKCNRKYMTYVVSCAWDAYWNHGWKGKILAPYKFIKAKLCIKYSDYVLYVTNEFLQKRYPSNAKFQVGCSDVKIDAMDNAIIDNRIKFLESWDGKVLNIATSAAVDVMYKGQQFVIHAMYELKKRGKSNIHYYLLGGGSQNRLKGLVQKYELEDQVHFMGIIPHKEVFDVLDRMHLYILPSLQEGLPRSMVEAMSRGLLCIGANTAAIPELIQSKYVIRRKSIWDIVYILGNISKEDLIKQAKVNFEEAKNYQEEVLASCRNKFFDNVINDNN